MNDNLERRLRALRRAGGQTFTADIPGEKDEAVPGNSPPLPVLTYAGLEQAVFPERLNLLPFMPQGSLVMIHAPRGQGKTWFALGMVAALVTGQRFLHWEVAKPTGVLFVDGEMDIGELRTRVRQLLPCPPVAALEILSHQQVFDCEEADMNFGRADWQQRLKDHMTAHPEIGVVVFDNLSCLLPTTAEDKRDDWARDVLPFLIWLRRRGIAAILIHHSNKSGGQRGSSAHEDQMTATIRLDPVEATEPNAGARFQLSFPKSRSAYGADVAPLDVTLVTDENGQVFWRWTPLAESNADRLLELVRNSDEGLSFRDAAEALGLSVAMVHKLKTGLVREGRLADSRILRLPKG